MQFLHMYFGTDAAGDPGPAAAAADDGADADCEEDFVPKVS